MQNMLGAKCLAQAPKLQNGSVVANHRHSPTLTKMDVRI